MALCFGIRVLRLKIYKTAILNDIDYVTNALTFKQAHLNTRPKDISLNVYAIYCHQNTQTTSNETRIAYQILIYMLIWKCHTITAQHKAFHPGICKHLGLDFLSLVQPNVIMPWSMMVHKNIPKTSLHLGKFTTNLLTTKF